MGKFDHKPIRGIEEDEVDKDKEKFLGESERGMVKPPENMSQTAPTKPKKK